MSLSKSHTATAYIALGSNLGDREEHLRAAMDILAKLGSVAAISSFYETEPVGDISQPDFLNGVIKLRTRLQPEELMTALLRIEKEQGRDRSISPPKGPRTLDLDLLSYDNVVLETPDLTLPHPALAQRRFVLVPLAEIAPQWKHPLSGATVVQLLAALPKEGAAHRRSVQKLANPPQST